MTTTAALAVEGELPDLSSVTAWLNSAPLTSAGLGGRVVVAQFCTFFPLTSLADDVTRLRQALAWQNGRRSSSHIPTVARS